MNKLDGTWEVKAKSGPWWFYLLNLVGDKKIISGASGYNIAKHIKWGKFEIRDSDGICLHYKNLPIVDKVKFVNNNDLLGKFFWRNKYVGDFIMTRK